MRNSRRGSTSGRSGGPRDGAGAPPGRGAAAGGRGEGRGAAESRRPEDRGSKRGTGHSPRTAQPRDKNSAPPGKRGRQGGERDLAGPGAFRPPRKPTPRAEPVSTGAPPGEMRIAKALARAGLCSRRDAERWIAEGRVSVNGETLASPARDVGPSDRILVDGKPLPTAEPVKLWRYHKPRGVVTTHRDPEGRPTVFEKLPADMPRVMSIGRLDFNTEGLLLLTNDGALARHLELPATGWLRRYRVRAHGKVTQADLDRLRTGVEVEGVRYGPVEATLEKEQGANVWLSIALREGKNREVRKVLGTLGLDVNRLIRVSFGPFQLLDLVPGAVDPVKRRVILDQLGPAIARELGLADQTEQTSRRSGPGGRGSKPKDEA